MSAVNNNPVLNSFCVDELFSYSAFSKSSLHQKICTVALHVFTFCIPLAVYHGVPRLKRVVGSWVSKKKTLAAARAELKEHPEIQPAVFSSRWGRPEKTGQPINQEIGQFASLQTLYEKNLRTLVKTHGKDAWENKEVLEVADKLVKIAYTVSILTLEEQCHLNKTMSIKESSYAYQTLFYLPEVYHRLRGGLYDKREDEAYASFFYQSSAVQNQWRCLHNNFCNQVKKHTDVKHLRQTNASADCLVVKDRFKELYRVQFYL